MVKSNVLYITISICFQNSRQILISAQMKNVVNTRVYRKQFTQLVNNPNKGTIPYKQSQ